MVLHCHYQGLLCFDGVTCDVDAFLRKKNSASFIVLKNKERQKKKGKKGDWWSVFDIWTECLNV